MLSLLVIGSGCYALSTWIAPLTGGALEAALKVFSVILFVVLCLATGAIPARHRRTLWQIFRSALRPGGRSPALVARALELPRTDRRIVMAITRDRESPARVSVLTGLPEASVRVRLVAALKQITDVHTPPEEDEGIAQLLLDFDSVTAQDRLARELWEDRGVSPSALLDIESAFKALRGASAKVWSAGEEQITHHLNLEARPLDPATLKLLDEVVRRGGDGKEAAPPLGVDAGELDRRLVAALRSVDGDGASHPADRLVGAFLIGGPDAPPASQLWAAGVDPLELHGLDLTLEGVRKVPRRKWDRIARRRRRADA
jgi:hypothetical protein